MNETRNAQEVGVARRHIGDNSRNGQQHSVARREDASTVPDRDQAPASRTDRNGWKKSERIPRSYESTDGRWLIRRHLIPGLRVGSPRYSWELIGPDASDGQFYRTLRAAKDEADLLNSQTTTEGAGR